MSKTGSDTGGRRLRRFFVDTRPLAIPAYRRLWMTTIVTALGSQMTAVAVPKQIYDITGSSAYVGISGLVALVPLVIFALWGGAIADAVDRRKLLLVTNSGIALTCLLLWIQAAADNQSVVIVLILLGVQQACFGVNQPTRAAAIVRLVPPAQLLSANSLNATVFMLGGIIGPMLAGVLMPVIGLPTLYLLDSIALCAALWAVWRLPPLPPKHETTYRPGIRSVAEGFAYLATRSVLLMSFLADIIAMVLGMPRALFPEMAVTKFGDPAGGGFALGALYAAIPIGAFLGSLFSGAFSRMRRYGTMVVIAVLAWGLAITAFGFMSSIWLAVLFLGIAGAADVVSMVFRRSILQTAATDEMQGRLHGVFTVVVAGGPRVADLLHGTGGAALGTTAAVAGGGVLVIVCMIIAVLCFPAFWRYRGPVDRSDEPEKD